MHPVSVEESPVCVSYVVQPSDLNGYKLLHGGRLLTLADETGYLAAQRYCRMDCLTVAVHRAGFHRPAGTGDPLRLKATVALTGTSSIWVCVDVCNHRGEMLMDAVFVYAAVDGNRSPVRVPNIEAISPAGKALQLEMQRLKSEVTGERC